MISRWFKPLFSLFLVFHLICIVVAPNQNTYLGAVVAPVLKPYAEVMEFTSSWSFFAPEPGPPPVFIEWEVLDESGMRLAKGDWPSKEDPFFFRERQNRRIATAKFMVLSDVRTEGIMAPYLCRKHPGAHSVALWRVLQSIPSLQDVASGRRKIGDDQGIERRWVSRSFCGGLEG